MRGILVEKLWKMLPQRVKAPQTKREDFMTAPEYHETRETLWEYRGTTPEG